MSGFFKHLQHTFSLSGIFYIILGAVLLFFPTLTGRLICYLFGSLILFYGILHTISFFALKGTSYFASGDLISGLISLVIGIFIITKTRTVISILPFILGVIIAIHGIFNISQAFEVKKHGYRRWWILLLMAAGTSALGILLIFNPFQAASIAVSLVGLSLILAGICDIWAAYRAEKLMNEAEPSIIVIEDQEK